MAREKPTQQGLDDLVDRRSKFRARLEHIDALDKQKESLGWPHLKAVLEEFVELAEKSKDNIVEFGGELDDHEYRRRVAAQQAQRDAFRYVVTLVEKSEDEASKLRAKLGELDIDIEDKKRELKMFGLAEV